jgi:hypothetical protein
MNPAPAKGELEITLFGPGYGESIALHVGAGAWVLVDSCIDGAGEPKALQYLTDLGVDPARDVRLIERWLPIAALGIESTRERTPMTPFPAPINNGRSAPGRLPSNNAPSCSCLSSQGLE